MQSKVVLRTYLLDKLGIFTIKNEYKQMHGERKNWGKKPRYIHLWTGDVVNNVSKSFFKFWTITSQKSKI